MRCNKITMDRKQFLRISGGTAASLAIGKFTLHAAGQTPHFAGPQGPSGELLVLEAAPPAGTKAVRFFIDDMQVSELTDLYAVKTNTQPVWKTMIDPAWLEAGPHTLRIEADTAQGTQVIDKKTIQGKGNHSDRKISLTGAWEFAAEKELPAGALEGATPAAAQPGYASGTWTKIFVPNSTGAVSEKWNQYEGILGVYRRNTGLHFQTGEQLFITLQSCYWSGRVFVNGKEAGYTYGGYLPARFNITNLARQGDNQIAVVVDNRFTSMGPFKRLNEFYWNWGGLIQEVYIEKHASVSLTDLRAEGSMSGRLQISFTGLNAAASAQKKQVTIEVADQSGKKVLGPVQVSVTIPPGEQVVKLAPITVSRPQLWNLETPHLYTVTAKGDFGTLKVRTGFRDVKVSGSDITINGNLIHNLQGFDRHADYPGLGRTQPGGLPYMELKLLRDKGFRFFRPAHYPTTPEQLDAADELGLLVIEEINVTGLRGAQLDSKEVKDFAAQQLTKMINRDRSHPSIIAWSMGNENFTEEQGAESYAEQTIALGRSLDPTRLFTMVTHRHTTDKTFRFQDIVCQNYYAGWYAKDINAIVTILDAIQAYAGNKPILISEYGAEAIPGRTGTTKGSEFWQGFVVDAHNRLLNDRKHLFGKMYWCSTDFWCRPNWTGGSPEPVGPFHVKSLISFGRDHKKLGWRVMFSPVRIILNPHTVKANDLGGDIELAPDKETTSIQVVTIKELKGRHVKGTMRVQPPKGFALDQLEYPFEVGPEQGQSFTLAFKGTLASADKAAQGFIYATVDEDTEAQPQLLNFIVKEEKPKQ